MKHTYNISGMSCMSCVEKVTDALQSVEGVTRADVDKDSNSATVHMDSHVPLNTLQSALSAKDPKYNITSTDVISDMEKPRSWWDTYKPIVLVFTYITLVTLSVQWVRQEFDIWIWMRHFMAGFFLAFSFFKMLDLSAFADSYMSYDIIARRWRGWGYLYGFIELGLGLSYLVGWHPLLTNIIAFTVMSISIIGVLQSVLNKRKIQCACLGAVFNLPMSTVTIIEDALMIAMSGMMILHLT